MSESKSERGLVEPHKQWLAAAHVPLKEAVLLTLNIEPQCLPDHRLGVITDDLPAEYSATLNAVFSGLKHGLIEGRLEAIESKEHILPEFLTIHEIDHDRSIVMLKSLRQFVTEKRLSEGLLKLVSKTDLGFNDPNHDRYSIELAAAVEAWRNCGDDTHMRGRPKQRMEAWLRLNAVRLKLCPELSLIHI